MLRTPLVIISLIVVAVLSIGAIPVLAQSGTGSISGRVADSAGAVLQGARITLAQKDVYSISSSIGEFFVSDLAPGEYDLTVSYVGFSTFSKKVTVVAGKTTRIEAVMSVAAQNQSITVTAPLPLGEAEAINRQIAADNILQVQSNEAINSLPNATVADAAGRMPGVSLERDEGEGKYIQIRGAEPRLNNLTIDGISIPSPEAGVSEVKLDTIPANLVDSIEISKTLAPNLDANAIGGSVNLVTKTAGDQPTIDVGGIGGYTPIQGGRYMDLFDGTIGQRFGTNKRWGILIGGSYDFNNRGIDDLEPAPDNASRTPLYDSMDIREYAYDRTRYGFAGSGDYKLGDGSSIYLRGLFSDFQDYGNKWVYSLSNGSPPALSNETRRPDYQIASASAGAKHVFASSWLAWNFAASRSSQTAAAGNPGIDWAPLATSSLNSCVYSPTATVNPNLPQWTGCYPNYAGLNQYGLVDYITTQGITAQVNLAGDISYAKNFHIKSHFSTFQIGANVRNEHKGQNALAPEYCPVDNPMCQNGNPSGLAMFQANNFPSTFTNNNYYNGNYTLGPLTDYYKVQSFFNANPAAFVLNQSLTNLNSYPSNFDLVQRVSAGYVMDTIDLGRFRLQAGVRFEGTQLGTQGYVVTNDASGNYSGISSVTSGYTYVDVLPSANLRYRLTDDSAIRAFYGRGISRPDPMELVPYVQVDQSTNPYSISVGNPALKAEHANNFDLLYEHYLKPLGVVQGGVFYKDLSTPLYQFLFPVSTSQLPECPASQTTGCNETQWQNGASAKLYGLELSYQQYLAFLPGLMRGLAISANYTWTGSEAADLPGRTGCAAEGLPTFLCARPNLQRQASNLFNITPTYTRGRLFVSVGMSYNGSSIYQYAYTTGSDPSYLGPKGPAGDVYFYPHFQLDAQASFKMPRGFTFQLAGLNLTNEVFGFYMGSPQYVLQREYYGPTIQVGLRWSPPREKK